MNTETIIEALLFVSGEPISLQKLAELSGTTPHETADAVEKLAESLRSRGIRILQNNSIVTLVSAPEVSSHVEKLIKEEMLGDLSKAALETLTIIAYRHPIVRSEIDYIRGVNSSFTIRNLIARGLIERASASAGRGYRYRPTIEFMKFLGISSVRELPEYEAVQKELAEGIENTSDKEAY